MSVRYMSAAEAIRLIAPGHRVFVHGSAATPLFLLNELSSQAPRLTNVELTAVSTLGQLDITKPEFKDKFYFNSLFVSDNIRRNINGEN
ncbi:MAG: 4-hydroxybutyrate CoA-transferase, partial [Cytophagales bacterium]